MLLIHTLNSFVILMYKIPMKFNMYKISNSFETNSSDNHYIYRLFSITFCGIILIMKLPFKLQI